MSGTSGIDGAVSGDFSVTFRLDEPEYSPAQVASRLTALASKGDIAKDSYSLGGEVSRLEEEMAAILGKERAVFMPTGTLANHLAIRLLARRGRRVLVQERSHLYQDVGDAPVTLSGLSLIPLAEGRACYSLEEAQKAFSDAEGTRVRTAIGALSIESPIRRLHGEAVDFRLMQALSSWARDKGIGTHLDGARLFIASRYAGIPMREYAREYAALFDTVYISLYKYFGAPSGAILAGPGALLEGLYHERRMFGGGLNQAWIFAALARDGLIHFESGFGEAVEISEEFIRILSTLECFSVSRIPSGTNIFVLRLADPGDDPRAREAAFVSSLRSRNILMPEPVAGEFHLKVNTSLRGHDPRALADIFAQAAAF